MASQALMTIPSVYNPSFASTVSAIKGSTRFIREQIELYPRFISDAFKRESLSVEA